MFASALKKIDILNLSRVFAFLFKLFNHPIDTIGGLIRPGGGSGHYIPPTPAEMDIDKEELIEEEVDSVANLQELAEDNVVEKLIAGDYDDIDPGEVYDIIHNDYNKPIPCTQREAIELYRECTNWTIEECKNFYRGHVDG